MGCLTGLYDLISLTTTLEKSNITGILNLISVDSARQSDEDDEMKLDDDGNPSPPGGSSQSSWKTWSRCPKILLRNLSYRYMIHFDLKIISCQ